MQLAWPHARFVGTLLWGHFCGDTFVGTLCGRGTAWPVWFWNLGVVTELCLHLSHRCQQVLGKHSLLQAFVPPRPKVSKTLRTFDQLDSESVNAPHLQTKTPTTRTLCGTVGLRLRSKDGAAPVCPRSACGSGYGERKQLAQCCALTEDG